MSENGRHPADHGQSYGAAQSRSGAPRVLVLGGSADGFAAAEAFSNLGYEVITSFAGRTETRRAPAGLWRVGGFGGAKGLAAYLAVEDIALVVDATHPFAAIMKQNADKACADVGTPLIHVVREPWRPEPGDDWRLAASLGEAARITPVTEGPCFLTVGRMKISTFAKRHDVSYVVRTVDPPEKPFEHPNATFIYDRGPYTIEAERALFDQHRIGCLVTANSGGQAAQAKLQAARERGVPVVVVDRPPPPAGHVVATVDEAVARTADLLGRSAA